MSDLAPELDALAQLAAAAGIAEAEAVRARARYTEQRKRVDDLIRQQAAKVEP